jgi:uncharacterized SAM-binding protein YcdF (DUF218 family)
MNDPVPSKITRLSQLPKDIAPPHDGWPALEARLCESGRPQLGGGAQQSRGGVPARRWRPQAAHIAALAAVLAAVVVGISIDRWILSSGGRAPQGGPARQVAGAPGVGSKGEGLAVSYIADPKYVRERAALLRSLDAQLARLPPPTRRKVLDSLAIIHQSMREIQQALGRDPGNALLQELLIDTYQNEMQVLSTVQQASGGSGET